MTAVADTEIRRCVRCQDLHMEIDFGGTLCGWCRDEVAMDEMWTWELSMQNGPDGRPSVVVNIGDEYHIGLYDPDEVDELSESLAALADDLREEIVRRRNALLS